MSSPPTTHPYSASLRHGTFLLLQDEPSFVPKGHSALASLIKSRSAITAARDEEEAGGPARRLDEEQPRRDERRMSDILNGPHMRSMRLIGNSNPRYQWEKYWKTEEQLKGMKKPIRQYYERTNKLIQQYRYIDKLLDSSLPHDLLNEYNNLPAWAVRGLEVPATITEEPHRRTDSSATGGVPSSPYTAGAASRKVRRTPKDIYRPTETTPLLTNGEVEHDPSEEMVEHNIPWLDDSDDDVDSTALIVTLALNVNLAANVILLAGKIAVVATVPSMSVLASLVDAVLDFLSTVIVGVTTWLIRRRDHYRYPVGRRRLEPIGVLIFSVVMVTSFTQVAIEAVSRLLSPDHRIIELPISAIGIMLGTIIIKGACWLWCRLVKNSSVRALASDAMTGKSFDAPSFSDTANHSTQFADVIFNAGSIAFPIVGFYAKIWWLDALGGLLLSLVVITNWSSESVEHIKHLTGSSATADQRNILLYLTMRFAKTIKQIQGLQAYHTGDKLNCEVDIVLDPSTSLKDSHDLSESLQYVLESVPIVDRAFVHVDYASWNLPTHMEQQAN
ncbi:hypothetical protein QBC37DRAFT_186241 [Rhypophila decipiens]|uniref:Cation efflux protein transmembrane domain-containing protein n=1 Tax=Rhypophila decipiens TaxID=261697 RepID=A0AAN7B9C0_9PEZI|nr:hypothetical protein QBC37DRAFT_186241 [Rhypophila decipiens]